MANPNPPPPPMHSRWKKGQSGNPGGRHKAVLTKSQVEVTFQFLHSKTKEELKEIKDDKTSMALHAMIAAVMLKAIEHGDAARMQFLLDRAVGKVAQPVAIDNEAIVLEEIKSMSDPELNKFILENMPQPQIEGKKEE